MITFKALSTTSASTIVLCRPLRFPLFTLWNRNPFLINPPGWWMRTSPPLPRGARPVTSSRKTVRSGAWGATIAGSWGMHRGWIRDSSGGGNSMGTPPTAQAMETMARSTERPSPPIATAKQVKHTASMGWMIIFP